MYLLVIVLGFAEAMKYGVSIWTVFVYQFAFAFHGAYSCFHSKDSHMQDLMADTAVLGPTRWQFYSDFLVPMLLPRMFFGLLITSSVSLLMLVLTESYDRKYGIGGAIDAANNVTAVAEIIAFTIILALYGIVIWVAILILQKKMLPWRP